MHIELERDRNGNIKAPESDYKPGERVVERTRQVLLDYSTGHQIMNKPRQEFNDRSVIEYMNDNQRSFNSYVPPRSEDPDESWRAQTVRPITRNKIISIGAHMTKNILIPKTFAQNDSDEEDRDAAHAMDNMLEWVINNSNYPREFFFGVISALVNPVLILQADYAEVMQTIREKHENGEITEKEMVDEILSGFQTHIIPPDEFYIANFYEREVQRQRFVAPRRFIQWSDAKAMYGHHANFAFVKPGVRTVMVDEEPTFYEQRDDALNGDLVEEFVYYNRQEDLKLTFLNGVLMEDPDNPNPRKDKLYPFATTGFEPVNEGKCFYYKSAADKLGHDQEIVDTLYNMIIDGTFLQLMPPMAHFGNEEIDASVMVPGALTNLNDPDNSKLEALTPRMDLNAGLQTMSQVERSMSESSSVSDTMQGAQSQGETTAFEISQTMQSAQINLGLFGKMIGFLVEDYGKLMIGDILQHMTVAQALDTQGTETKMKFRTFLLPEKTQNGKKVTERVEITDERFGVEEETEDEQMQRSMQILEEETGGRKPVDEADKRLLKVNPHLFRQLKFRTKVNPDNLQPENEALNKALNLEAYDRAVQHPMADQEAVYRDFLLENYRPGESSKYIKRRAMQNPEDLIAKGAQEGMQQRSTNQNLVGQITGSNSLQNAFKTQPTQEGARQQ